MNTRIFTVCSLLALMSSALAASPTDVSRLSVAVDGRALKVEPVRCSKMPFNRRWPGHQRPKDQTEICGLARFTLTKPTEVVLEVHEPFSRVTVRPLSKGVKPSVDGRRVRFTVAAAGQYSVEIDGWHRNLFLFADPPEAYDVDRNDPKTRWFGPGEHDVGLMEMKSGETVYLAEGAVVYGRIHARDADDIRILGRGILDASRVKETVIRNDPAKDEDERRKGFAVANVKRYDTIRLEYCDRVTIDGIIIRDSLIYNIRPICCRDLEIRNVKAIGSWRYNADGFDLHNCERVTIRDSFIRTYDDALCIKGLDCWMKESDMEHDGYRHDVFRDVLVSNVVTWCDWGYNFEIGAETRAREIANVRFVDCDAIRASFGVCDVQSVDWADIHDVTYENIRAEFDGEWMAPQMQQSDDQKYAETSGGKYGGKLLSSSVYQHPEYSAGGTRRGRNHRILFKDIFVTGEDRLNCVFAGSSPESRTYDVTIDGVYRNGRRVKSLSELNVATNAFAGPIRFRALEATALVQPNLKWELSEYSTLTNGILTVDVPKGAKPALYGATAYVGLEPFEGRTLGAKVMASGENIALPANSCHGLKLMLHFQSSVSGDDCWPDAPHRIGSFGKTWLEVGDTLSGGARSPWGTIHVGLQGTSGKVVFDMNTFEITSGESIFPRENGNYKVRYPEAVSGAAQRRGVQLPAVNCTEDDFRTLAAWGATLARYQMTDAPHVQNGETPEQALPRYFAWLDAKLEYLDKEVLPWANKYGIDIVVDLHEPPGKRVGSGEFRMMVEKPYCKAFLDVWRKIATRFKGRKGIYGYDLVNEPNQSKKTMVDYWTVQKLAAEEVRKIDPDTPIIIESNGMDSPRTFTYLSPLAMDNVIYEVHMYEPGDYTHQGVRGEKDFARLEYPRGDRNRDYLVKSLAAVRKFEEKHHAKIYVGEFSAAGWAPGADRYLRDCISIFREYGWDWTYHAFREWPGWSVEHEPVKYGVSDDCFRKSEDNPRKRALIDGLRDR